ncbi:hypothetical protein [Roseibacillus persicicus]|uniref:pyroglutamyl-peptidase I family protein n=1 Tax=Roseibacillus persicicus TaxID=454148 RepID=UPI002811CF5A|nr:hypothetical protein [Roseibacillus persicicus]
MILMTGFLPFRGRSENGSQLIAESFREEKIDGEAVEVEILPVLWHGHQERLQSAVKRCRPDLILSLGEGSADWSRFERLAVNEAAGPDEEGRPPLSLKLDPEGPEERRSSFPFHPSDFPQSRWPIRESEDAGLYLCNATFFHSLGTGIPSVFLHLPILGENEKGEYLEELRQLVATVVRQSRVGEQLA